MELALMKAEIVLKCEERQRLLQVTPDNSSARAVLTCARGDSNQPELVIINCDEQTASTLLEVAARHGGSAWRVMNYQMTRLGLIKSRSNR
jgi:hypothetical protein